MSTYMWPREPLQDPRWRSDACRHRHRTREAAERCDQPTVHWLPQNLNEGSVTACGLDVNVHRFIEWRVAQNETTCERCLSARNVPEMPF